MTAYVRRGRVALAAAVCVVLMAAFDLTAVTQAEWEADNSLIPAPSGSSAFYVVSPTARDGEQTVSASSAGLDATPLERTYELPFSTALSTHAPGFLVIIQ